METLRIRYSHRLSAKVENPPRNHLSDSFVEKQLPHSDYGLDNSSLLLLREI
jgi:hypothetical protein